MTDMRTLLGMSLQRALLGQIPPELRGLEVRAADDHADLLFYFDGDPSAEDAEIMADVETEVLADVPDTYGVESRPIAVPRGTALPTTGFWVYRRRE